MSSPPNDRAYLLATGLLDEAVKALAAGNREVPSQVYVSPGSPSWDCCDSLTANVTRVFPLHGSRDPRARDASCAVVWAADVTLTLLRCVPGIVNDRYPTADAMDASARGLLADAGTLHSALACENPGDCGRRGPNGWDIRGPQGNCAAVVLKLELTL